MLYCIEIWRIRRLIQQLKLVVVLLKLFLKHICIIFFINLSNSSFIRWIRPHMPAFPPRVRPCLPIILLPVHHCSFLGPLLIDTDHCRLGTPHKSCSYEDALTRSSSHHNLALIKLAQTLLLLTHQLGGQHVHSLPIISHPLTGVTMKR